MMAGNPNWWSSMSNMHHHLSSQYIPTTTGSSSQLPFSSLVGNNQDFPQSWSQLLMEEGAGNSNEDKYDTSHFQTKKMEFWEEEILNPSPSKIPFIDVKLEALLLSQQSHQLYGHQEEQLFHASRPPVTWSGNFQVSSSPARSCVSSSGNNNRILEYSDSSKTRTRKNNQLQDHTSECKSTATNGVCKKARVQSSSLPPLKVRKEKLGDRITALHQLVSPFGKTDTASVLLETFGSIRFLQSQIEALCSPYLGNGSERDNQNSVQGERNFIFPKDPGGLQEGSIDLRSRGLSLVPISYTHHLGSDNGADLWTPAAQGEF